jgi:hypothetical protein
MSCTPGLGEMTTAPFAIFSILVLIDYCVFLFSPVNSRHFTQPMAQLASVRAAEQIVASSNSLLKVGWPP